MMEHGKDLPPITLSNTTISYLVTLIPLLVSMTSRGEIPSYEDEADKPAWWPEDIQWRNPKCYMQDSPQKPEGLKVLRKLVYSCYSYHGVEDLLMRLEESPVSDVEMEPMDSGDIIQLTEDYEDGVEESSAESEGPVFVCCFCLDQFNSHEEVSTHQNICQKRFKDTTASKDDQLSDGALPKSEQDVTIDIPTHKNIPAQSVIVQGPESHRHSSSESVITKASAVSPSSSLQSSSSSSSSSISRLDDTFLSQPVTSSSSSAASVHTAHSLTSAQPVIVKKPAYVPYPFVPTLKTRSQKKLDQMMEKHNLRQLMIRECREMKDVPETGAWWVKHRKPTPGPAYRHPDTYLTQGAFVSVMGLAKTADVKAMNVSGPKPEQEVDLDCEIVSVEGPISCVPIVSVERTSSVSPRAARSLISQLSRDSEGASRRRMSFSFVEDEWADKEALEEGRDPLQQSLLTLDFSSPLGIRVRKYVKGEGYLNIIKDAECYCRTELDEDGYSKLRFRGNDYRITYRRKRRSTNYVHKYKFNRQDRLEFKCYLKTGLNARSRRLQRGLPECKVVLTRLTGSEIKAWTEEKKITIAEKIIYDDDICITQIEIPESKVTQARVYDNVKRNTHSSHTQLYKARHRPGPLSSHSLGHTNSALSKRKSMVPHAVPSPLHVPNIFRNRTSHTPSPPRPSSSTCPTHSHFASSQLSLEKARTDSGRQEPSKLSYTPLSKVSAANHQQKSAGKSAHHLSGHMSLPPSAYTGEHSYRHIGGSATNGMDKQSLGQLSRRKQLMTHVRKDEGEQRTSHSSVAHFTNPFMRSLTDSRPGSGNAGVSSTSSNNSTSDNLTLFPSSRKLSNFDYFTIRNNKIFSSAPNCSESTVNSPAGHVSSKISSTSAGQSSQQISHSGHTCHRHSSAPHLSSLHSHHHHHHLHQNSSGSNRGQPCSVIHHRPSPHQKRPLPGARGIGPDTEVHDEKNKVHNRPLHNHPHKAVTAPSSSQPNLPSSQPKPIKLAADDDDILEIICIDDD